MSEKMTPEIRFRGFEGEWKYVLLGDISSSYSGGTPSVGIKEYYGGDIPFIRSAEINSMSTELSLTKFGLVNSSAKLVNKGDILYALYGATSGEVGRARINGAINQAILAIIPNQFNSPDFITQWLKKSKDSIVKTFLQGGQGNLSAAIVKDLVISSPVFNEQKRIGALFAALDRTIDLQRRKLEKLQMFKSSMLQKMFPKEGSLTPEIRFSGFEGEWKHISFGEAFSLLSNNTLSRADLNYENGDFLNVHYGDVLIKFNEILNVSKDELPYITDSFNSDKIRKAQLQNGDVVIADTAEDETVGKAVEIADILNTPVVSGLHTIPCRPIIQFAPKYLGFYLNSPSFHNQLIPLMQGIKVTSISKSALSDTYVLYPHNLREQERIGILLDQLNFKIAFLSKKLTKLQNLKQSLLQKMFV